MQNRLLPPSDTTQKVKQTKTLSWLNKGAGFLHATNFITGLILVIIFNNQSIVSEITTDFNATSERHTTYQLLWVELPFSAITSIFHFYLGWGKEKQTRYFDYVFRLGQNPYRWIEYGITASLMTWVILQVAGATNVLLLILAGIICNMVLQYQGYLMEVLNPPSRTKTNWGPTVAGWFLFCGQWAVIFAYFFNSVTTSNAPWYVYTIIIGCFLQFCIFGIVQLLQFTKVVQTPYGVEVAYITLSYTSKFYLNWNLIIAMLTQ